MITREGRTFHARFTSPLPVPGAEAFAWHARPGAFERLSPPYERVRVISNDGSLAPGSRVEIELKMGPLKKRWVAEHISYDPPTSFSDRQVSGPFRRFEHEHVFVADGEAPDRLEDRIRYELPLGFVGRLFGAGMAKKRLRRMFGYRHRTTIEDLAAHASFEGAARKRVLISGASGLVGRQLAAFLTTGGHTVVRLVRHAPKDAETEIQWTPDGGVHEPSRLEGFDAVVHLAGESIASGRWTKARKKRIAESRSKGTRVLAEALAQLRSPPEVLVCASAVGYYGDSGDTRLTEDAPAGDGFLADVCKAWEAACEPAREAGIRVANMRFGVILSPAGGALAKMLTPFKMGVGGRIGSGEQGMSWIALDDAVGAIHHALQTSSLDGPVNTAAPEPVSNRAYTKALGKVLGRWTFLPMPAFAARLVFGEMANELLLASQFAVPERLTASGYAFRHPTVESALAHGFGRVGE